MTLRILIWSILIMFLSGLLDTRVRADDSSSDLPQNPSWGTFISVAAEKLGLHFTMEEATPEPQVLYESVNLGLKPYQGFANADAFLAYLQKSKKLAAYSFERDQGQRDVIHIVDRRLIGLKGYALEKKVDLEFAGNLMQLCWTLHRRIGNMVPQRFFAIGSPGWGDYTTEICLSVKDRTVRGLLTEAVPVKCYNLTIWTAITELTDVNHRRMLTEVTYSGLDLSHSRPVGGYNCPWYLSLLEEAGSGSVAGSRWKPSSGRQTIPSPARLP